MPLVIRYLRDNPAVEIDLVLSDHFVDLIEEGYEAVFRIGPLADTSLMAIELRPFRLAACASPEYPRERGYPSIRTISSTINAWDTPSGPGRPTMAGDSSTASVWLNPMSGVVCDATPPVRSWRPR